jgi:pyruvate-formate lyase-activating enzyme
MTTSAQAAPELLRSRNQTVAKSFYRQLKTEGFSHEQIIELSATLLDLVNQDLKDPRSPPSPTQP